MENSSSSIAHGWLYRAGTVAVMTFFIGLMGFVLVKAQARHSGSTGIDASRMLQMRYDAAAEMAKSEKLKANDPEAME